MAKFLFVVPPFFGHISPTLSVGAVLLNRGHSVRWVGYQELPAGRLPAGGEFVAPEIDGEQLERILKRQDDGPSIGGAAVLKLALEETYLPLCRMMMRELPGMVDRYEPDLIVSDCITFAGGVCAHICHVPYVTTTPVPPDVMGSTMDMPRIREWQERSILDLQREFGIYADHPVIHSNRMNIVFTSREFAGIGRPSPELQFVGPVQGRPGEAEFDWERLERSAGPKVFISLGTLLVDIRRAYFQKMVEAFSGQPLTVVVATDPSILPFWPDNFIVQAYVPQSRLMEKMDAVICHGGFNTVNDAILHALPILITPIAYDHFHTASLVEAAGCGLSIRYKRMRAEDVRAAVWQLLMDKTFRVAVEEMRASFLRAGGAPRAADLLEASVVKSKISI